MAWQPPDRWLWLFRPFLRLGWYIGRLLDWLEGKIARLEGRMLKIGVVGDLSLQDPARLWKALSAACSTCDIVVQVGDCHPGYEQMKQAQYVDARISKTNGPRFLAVPGNHDIDWEKLLSWPRFWKRAYKYPNGEAAVTLVGLDNSKDAFHPDTWTMLGSVPADGTPLIIFCHKPLSTIVLPDGSESNHTMEEGGPNADAERLKDWCCYRHSDHVSKMRSNRKLDMDSDAVPEGNSVLLVYGHYHGWSQYLPWYAPCLIEGRGGAAPEIGWTQIIVTPEGLVIHRFDL